MKFFIFFSCFIFLWSCTLSVRFKRTRRTYEQMKADFIAAAQAGGGVYLDHSWQQKDMIGRNEDVVRWAIGNLTASPKKTKNITGITPEDIKQQPEGVCAGMSVYFLKMMKILKEQEPQNQANQRVESEIATFDNPNVQNSIFMNALVLHNNYSAHIVSMGRDAIDNVAKNESLLLAEKTDIIRDRSSSMSLKDVDLEKQTENIHKWIKSKHRQSNYIIVEFRKHATAYVRISQNLKLFFDPNFGIVRFDSISRIPKFFEGLFQIPEVKTGYMKGDDTIGLRAYR